MEEVISTRDGLRKQVEDVKEGPLELEVRKLMVMFLGPGAGGACSGMESVLGTQS